MSFEITSDTVVKILIRRGEEYDRKLTLLTNGELGYSQNTKRLFIGDGVTLGGNPVSNLFLGVVAEKESFNDFAQNGDLVFQTTNNRLFVYDDNNPEPWTNIHPYFNERVFSEAGGEWYLDEDLFAPAFSYNPQGPGNSIDGVHNTIDFNKAYLSLSASRESFYFGDLDDRPPGLILEQKSVNVTERLFVHSLDNPHYQIQLRAREQDGASVIRAVRGTLYLQAPDEVSLHTNGSKVVETFGGSYVRIRYAVPGTYDLPNFQVDGNTRFVGNVNYDSDVTITGNLSVYGDVSYFETFVTATSSLSVINWSQNNTPALDVRQNFNAVDQPIALFYGNPVLGANRWPVLTIKDGPFVGIGTGPGSTRGSLNNAVFAVSGGALFNHVRSDDRFEVYTGSGGLKLNVNNNGDFRTRVEGSSWLETLGNYTLTAQRFFFDSTDITDPSIPAFEIYTNASNSQKAGLEISSSAPATPGTGNGFIFLPSASNQIWNPLTQPNDSVIIARNFAAADSASTGLVIGLHSTATKGIRIASDGDVGIGIADPGVYKLYVNGTSYFSQAMVVNSTIRAAGDITAFFTSDKQLKKDIQPISSALQKIDRVTGVEFNWDEEKQTDHIGHDVGVIAQEMEEVLPEVVTTRENGYKAVRYEKIVPLLIQAIKELKQQVEQLKNKE
jgi:hypothetical protein